MFGDKGDADTAKKSSARIWLVWVIEEGWRNSFGDQDSESPFPFSGLGLAEMGCHQEKE